MAKSAVEAEAMTLAEARRKAYLAIPGGFYPVAEDAISAGSEGIRWVETTGEKMVEAWASAERQLPRTAEIVEQRAMAGVASVTSAVSTPGRPLCRSGVQRLTRVRIGYYLPARVHLSIADAWRVVLDSEYLDSCHDLRVRYPASWKRVRPGRPGSPWTGIASFVGPAAPEGCLRLGVDLRTVPGPGGTRAHIEAALSELMRTRPGAEVKVAEETRLLDREAAWLRYTYRGPVSLVEELNVGIELGGRYAPLLRFICSALAGAFAEALPTFAAIVLSTQIGKSGPAPI